MIVWFVNILKQIDLKWRFYFGLRRGVHLRSNFVQLQYAPTVRFDINGISGSFTKATKKYIYSKQEHSCS
jgi:hypothetical protein